LTKLTTPTENVHHPSIMDSRFHIMSALSSCIKNIYCQKLQGRGKFINTYSGYAEHLILQPAGFLIPDVHFNASRIWGRSSTSAQ